jgi:DNA-binding response OmpR family regulator
MSLLLVHANSDDREMYAEYLRNEGFAVQQAATTDEALPLVAAADAVITGLMVPGTGDPIEFIRRVRAQSSTLPIIVVTACVLDDRIEQAYRAGANIVLTKPCLPDTLLLAVQATNGAKE